MSTRTLTAIEQLITDLGYTEMYGIGLWGIKTQDTPVFDTNTGTAKMSPSIDASHDDYIGFADTQEELDGLFVKWQAHLDRLAKPIPEHMIAGYRQGYSSEEYVPYKGAAGPTEGHRDRNTIALYIEAKHDCDANVELVHTNIPGTDEMAMLIKLPNSGMVSYDRWGFCSDNTEVTLDQESYDAALEFILINS